MMNRKRSGAFARIRDEEPARRDGGDLVAVAGLMLLNAAFEAAACRARRRSRGARRRTASVAEFRG
ncbi:MAG TPA: hypothetical protein DHV08_15285 [Rhodocyclaceae bacterium]|nr:MAG: hypothetical protein AUK49_13265 [Betaproteobacteria bacterium CG2_30_68_42]PIV73573.1 MAG: hypothetical protein COW56_06490 [Rhodocyclales bacterium CG17_big_fil_post_rev_8_21_14_2_50_68_7]PJA57952.1 MAG: hypothetical protein CO164_04935 [Rhodocyclales bacterium CG_4_9_14_3_um_filter_68_10]HCX34769.1 hypothetical protein [Rhodocyclaceae bacterium]